MPTKIMCHALDCKYNRNAAGVAAFCVADCIEISNMTNCKHFEIGDKVYVPTRSLEEGKQ